MFAQPGSRRSIIDRLGDYWVKDLVVVPFFGGSFPIFIFKAILDVPSIGVSVAKHDNIQRQPDENIRIGHLWQGIEMFVPVF